MSAGGRNQAQWGETWDLWKDQEDTRWKETYFTPNDLVGPFSAGRFGGNETGCTGITIVTETG